MYGLFRLCCLRFLVEVGFVVIGVWIISGAWLFWLGYYVLLRLLRGIVLPLVGLLYDSFYLWFAGFGFCWGSVFFELVCLM